MAMKKTGDDDTACRACRPAGKRWPPLRMRQAAQPAAVPSDALHAACELLSVINVAEVGGGELSAETDSCMWKRPRHNRRRKREQEA